MAGREVGKMRQGREGLFSSRGPFAGVWGPFCRKGGLFWLDFSAGLPEALPWGQQPLARVGCFSARSFLQWVLRRRRGERGCRGVMARAGARDFSGGGVAAGGLGLQGRVTMGYRLRLCSRRENPRSRQRKPPPATTLGTVPLPPGPTTPRTASPGRLVLPPALGRPTHGSDWSETGRGSRGPDWLAGPAQGGAADWRSWPRGALLIGWGRGSRKEGGGGSALGEFVGEPRAA